MKKDSATEREAEGAWSCPLGLLTPSKGKSLMMSIGIFSAWRASSLLGLSGITGNSTPCGSKIMPVARSWVQIPAIFIWAFGWLPELAEGRRSCIPPFQKSV